MLSEECIALLEQMFHWLISNYLGFNPSFGYEACYLLAIDELFDQSSMIEVEHPLNLHVELFLVGHF
jgi:hypothetical protein